MPTINTTARTLTTALAPAPFNDRFARVLGSALTPQQVTAILDQASIGYMWGQADLLDEIRERDGHLHNELQKRELRVSGAPWELVPPEGSGQMGAEIARFCTARLNDIEARTDLDRSFADALTDLMGAVFHGRAGAEVTWRTEGRWTLPDALSWIHPRRFAYTTDWRLHLWDAAGTSASVEQPVNVEGPFGTYPGLPLDRFPAGKFLLHRPRIRGVYPTREGLGRLLVWWATFKRFDLRSLLAYMERVAGGLRIGTYATGKGPMGDVPSSPEDQAVLLNALEVLSSACAIVVADTTKAEIKDSPSDNEVHDRLATLCNDEMSKAIVGGTLGSAVSAAGGSRSQGEVHERGELLIAKADARSLAATVRRDLLRPMVVMNFGPRAAVPLMTFAVDPVADLKGLADRMKTWKDMGGRIGQRSGANALQLPEIEDDEETLGGPVASAPEAPALPPPASAA